jgi:isocitrate/isopropylmalate dehydrogenase
MIRLAVIPGDGIGREVLAGPLALLAALGNGKKIEVTGPWPAGASAYAATGTVLPDATLRACEEADAILLGAIGQHPGASPEAYQQPSALWTLRTHFGLRLSIRDVLRPEGEPLVIVRNLLGGAYGEQDTRQEGGPSKPAWDRIELSGCQIAEVVRAAADILGRFKGHRLLSADKANLFATSRLWRAIVQRIADERGVAVEHCYVDRLAYDLARALPAAVIVTEGIFGDILSDVAAATAGSIALSSSASVNPGPPLAGRCRALFEPVHGSAPRRAGHGVANPSGAYLALVAALEWQDETRAAGAALRRALLSTMRTGVATYDLVGHGARPVSTAAFAEHVNRAFAREWHELSD